MLSRPPALAGRLLSGRCGLEPLGAFARARRHLPSGSSSAPPSDRPPCRHRWRPALHRLALLLLLDQGAQRVLVAVGELAGIEVAGLLVDDLLGDRRACADRASAGPGARTSSTSRTSSAVRSVVSSSPSSSISMAQMRSRVLITSRPSATVFFCFMASRITAKASTPVLLDGHQVIGHVPVEPVDRGARHELLDVDDARRFELHRVEVFLVEAGRTRPWRPDSP